MEEMATERTPLSPLLSGQSYNPGSYYTAQRNKQMKQFQCCICIALLMAFIAALIVSITYSLVPNEDINNSTSIDNSTIFPDQNASAEILNLLIWPLGDESPIPWNLTELSDEEKAEAIQLGQVALIGREKLEENLSPPPLKSPTFKHQKAVGTSFEARIQARKGYIEDHATRAIVRKRRSKRPQGRWNVGNGPKIEHEDALVDGLCDFNAKFRTANGTCNNKENPYIFGVAMTPFRRLLNPDYVDGVSAPRAAVDGKPLPSARQVSLEIHRPSYATDPQFTVMLAVWGQFLDHDITATALNQGVNGEPIECCNLVPALPLHPECFPVPIGQEDPFYKQFNVTCMNFVRCSPASTRKFGPRQQLNQATAFIDGSVIYGSSEVKQQSLRTFKDGELRMFWFPNNRSLLPVSKDPYDGCNEDDMNSRGRYCFESGDSRANENLHLTSMHLIWARNHNFLVAGLKRENPHWNDERLFQEGRRILGAQMQHITYNEFLSVVLGKRSSEGMGIISKPTNHQDVYNESVDSSIANSFAASAFRFAHTLLPRLFKITRDTSSPEGVAMHRMLFNPYSLYNETGLDDAVYSALETPLERSDPYFNEELKEKLFQKPNWSPNQPCGLDLVSLNIQRGRDHGLPSYPEFRKFCRLPPVNSWNDMATAVDSDSLRRMKEIYRVPANVDVYTGGLSEPPITGGLLGPLFTCLIGDQFVRLKIGDRFWYERRVGSQRFTDQQLRQIYNTLLSSVICRNSDAVTFTQRYVMKRSGPNNRLEDCRILDTFDFAPWREDSNLSPLRRAKISQEQISALAVVNSTMESTTLTTIKTEVVLEKTSKDSMTSRPTSPTLMTNAPNPE